MGQAFFQDKDKPLDCSRVKPGDVVINPNVNTQAERKAWLHSLNMGSAEQAEREGRFEDAARLRKTASAYLNPNKTMDQISAEVLKEATEEYKRNHR